MDPYVKDRWAQFTSDIIKEFKTVSEMHQALVKFQVS